MTHYVPRFGKPTWVNYSLCYIGFPITIKFWALKANVYFPNEIPSLGAWYSTEFVSWDWLTMLTLTYNRAWMFVLTLFLGKNWDISLQHFIHKILLGNFTVSLSGFFYIKLTIYNFLRNLLLISFLTLWRN